MAFAERSGQGSGYQLGALALSLAIFAILTALGFQYIGGYVPCMLCYMERYAYYAGIPVLFIALILTAGGYRQLAAILFFLAGLAFLANAGLGVYHAGAEWKFWPGPSTCGGGESLSTSTGNLLNDLQHIKVIKCDEAALRFLGISFAGWNVVASALVMVMSIGAGFSAWSRAGSR
jgi:disulfide bond formation protein DsbB